MLPKKCLIHNQQLIQHKSEIIKIQENEHCLMCMQNRLIDFQDNPDQIEKRKNQLINNTLQESSKEINLLMKFSNELQQLRQINQPEVNKILELIQDHMNCIQTKKTQLNQLLLNKNDLQSVVAAEIYCKQYQEFNERIRLKLTEWLEQSKFYLKIDNLIALLNENNQKILTESQLLKKFRFKQLSGFQIKDDPRLLYCSFTFNANGTILFVGQTLGKISVFGFNNKRKQIQLLSQSLNPVKCLVWMKNLNCLISGSLDINIWNDQRIILQRLTGHYLGITCLITNFNNDLLISGSTDKIIKFWGYQNSTWSFKQKIDTGQLIHCLSLSLSQTKLISCGWKSSIIVLKLYPNNKWIITQTIKVSQTGSFRLCFINDYQFVVQPIKAGFLEIYIDLQEQNKFQKVNQVQVQSFDHCDCGFPCQIIDSKNILTVKNGKNINFFGMDQNQNLILKYSIEENNYIQFGTISNNGNFLVNWPCVSRQIQIWILQYQND